MYESHLVGNMTDSPCDLKKKIINSCYKIVPFSFFFFFLHFLSDWKKINNESVCYKADSHGSFRITKQGLIHAFKLVHRRGSLKCAQHIPATFWGCTHPSYDHQTLSTVITYRNNSVLPLAEYRQDHKCAKYSYKIEGIDVNSRELLFNHLPSPISVSNGQVFKIWYNEALLPNDCARDNSGEICVDVYALYA